MFGCVEAHELDRGRNDNLKGDDPKGVKSFVMDKYHRSIQLTTMRMRRVQLRTSSSSSQPTQALK